ncbi:hypothetical protein ABZ345_06615 [Lentzea sp. NPDC005914]|uniref:hypothetical protein n=1 Tax=Lentzea sp. NPDC005914 TaxID=3154572 RepID=UPI0033DDD5F2
MPEHLRHHGRAPETASAHGAVHALPHAVAHLGSAVGNRNLTAFLQREIVVQRQSARESYDAEVANASPNWSDAALHLNGCSPDDIRTRLAARTVAQVRQLHDAAVARPGVGPGSNLALLTPHLLSEFAGSFRDAAELVRRGDEALRLVREAEVAGVHFGGFAEDGPAHNAWAYTVGNQVYVPRAHTDPVVQMTKFLFELNNAIRRPAFAALDASATAGTITARQFARRNIEQEVEGMLRTARVWLDSKRAMGGGRRLNRYDAENYVSEYRQIESGRLTQAQLVDQVLRRRYTSGNNRGLTTEEFYMRQYRDLHRAPADAGVPDAGGRP